MVETPVVILNMLTFLGAGLAAFAFVFTKAFQQRNVAFDNYIAVIPTSILMSATEVYVIGSVAKNGWHLTLVLFVGIGSGLGAVCAMFLHHHIFIKGKQQRENAPRS